MYYERRNDFPWFGVLVGVVILLILLYFVATVFKQQGNPSCVQDCTNTNVVNDGGGTYATDGWDDYDSAGVYHYHYRYHHKGQKVHITIKSSGGTTVHVKTKAPVTIKVKTGRHR